MSDQAQDSPAWISPAYQEMQPRWSRCRDVRGGTEVFRAKRAQYLPKFEVESPKDWAARVEMTVVVDWLEQAITTFVGIGMRHDPTLGADVPPEIVEDWENLDGDGNHGAMVAQRALDQALTDGHVVLFTDHPTATATLTRQQEQELRIRPYVMRVAVDRIPSWRVGMIGGERWLLQFVIQETTDEPDGTFATSPKTRYRVFRQQFESAGSGSGGVMGLDLTRPYVSWETWEEVSGHGVNATVKTNEGTLRGPTRIPVAVVYGGQGTGILMSKPPFDGLAFSNIRWAQVMSDRTASLHRCGIPIPVIIGQLAADPTTLKQPADLKLSSSSPLQIDVGGDFKIVEAQGTVLEQARLELQDWEKRIGAQSLAILQRDTAGAETATAHRMNRGREESKLARALRSLEDALELSLQFMADYRGLDRELIDVTVQRDFGDVVDPQTLDLLSRLQERGQLTITRLLMELQRASVFGNDFVVADEVADIERGMGMEPMGMGPPPATEVAAMTDAELAAELAVLDAEHRKRVAAGAQGA